MALTLTEARTALSPFVDNGVCSTDSRVIARINEAQRRLHSARAWLGVLARYSVPVVNGQFTLPSYTGSIQTTSGFGLESAIRVASTTAPEGFLTNSVQAFLTDTGDVLPLNFVPTSSDFRTYAIEGAAPARVEVTGKLNYIGAAADTDLLVIDDVDAIKLMILALYREENNQLELAQALENKAIERLTTKTDRALEAARRLNYQTRKASTIPNSLGDFRAKLALDIVDGLRVSDSELVDLINNAEEALFARGCWYGTIESYRINVTNTNEILLPNAIGTILGVTMGNSPVSIFERRYDYHENGPGYQEKDSSGNDMLVDRGEVYVNHEWKRRYFIRDSSATECINVLAKKRWKSKLRDAEKMDIRNYPAVKTMVMALREKEPEKAMFYENKAIALLQKELSEMRGGAKNQLQIQMKNFALGEITALV
jgi:hypothetical protein